MKRNLYGEMMPEPIDYVTNIIDSLKSQKHNSIDPSEHTRRGFTTNADFVIPDIGIYCIYKNGFPVYAGYSKNSIRNRLGRFISVVRDTNRDDENHPGARKYLRLFGADLTGLTFKIFDFDINTLPQHITIEDIETELIYHLNTKFNKENYNGSFVDTTRITL